MSQTSELYLQLLTIALLSIGMQVVVNMVLGAIQPPKPDPATKQTDKELLLAFLKQAGFRFTTNDFARTNEYQETRTQITLTAGTDGATDIQHAFRFDLHGEFITHQGMT